MTISHHPSDAMLSAFAAGVLDLGQHVAVATHLQSCPQCTGFVRSMEQVGGALLSDLPPADLDGRAFERVQARLDEPAPVAGRGVLHKAPSSDLANLPAFVRGYRFGPWKWVAPSVHLRTVELPAQSDTRVFLLRSGPGTRMVQHSHTNLELTCVLAGAFSHAGGRFGPGDFDMGDDTIDHQPVVDTGETCVCLVAMQGELRLNGLIGRLMQPFVRL